MHVAGMATAQNNNEGAKLFFSWAQVHEEMRPRGKLDSAHWVTDTTNLYAGPVRRFVSSRRRNTRLKDVIVLNNHTKKERRIVFKNAIPCPPEGVILRKGDKFYKEISRDYRGATYEIVGGGATKENAKENAEVETTATTTAEETAEAATEPVTVKETAEAVTASKSGWSNHP